MIHEYLLRGKASKLDLHLSYLSIHKGRTHLFTFSLLYYLIYARREIELIVLSLFFSIIIETFLHLFVIMYFFQLFIHVWKKLWIATFIIALSFCLCRRKVYKEIKVLYLYTLCQADALGLLNVKSYILSFLGFLGLSIGKGIGSSSTLLLIYVRTYISLQSL